MARLSRYPFARGLDFSGARRIWSSEAPLLILQSLKLDAAAQGVDATASGVVFTESYSFTEGSANAGTNATANGETLSTTSSLTTGEATGQQNVTATGIVLTVISNLTPGAASGQSNTTASGAILALVHSIQPGSAEGVQNATAAGVTLPSGYTFHYGSASAPSETYIRNGGDFGPTIYVNRKGEEVDIHAAEPVIAAPPVVVIPFVRPVRVVETFGTIAGPEINATFQEYDEDDILTLLLA